MCPSCPAFQHLAGATVHDIFRRLRDPKSQELFRPIELGAATVICLPESCSPLAITSRLRHPNTSNLSCTHEALVRGAEAGQQHSYLQLRVSKTLHLYDSFPSLPLPLSLSLSLYICMSVCRYIYISTYLHFYHFLSISLIYIYIYICVCIYIYIYIFVDTYTYL